MKTEYGWDSEPVFIRLTFDCRIIDTSKILTLKSI